MQTLAEAYCREDGYVSAYDYRPLLASLGREILVQVDDQDYQGDSRLLLRSGDRYGILMFGWGSCSGCDALQACDTLAQIERLRDELSASIRWGSWLETRAYLREHDWDGDYHGRSPETAAFVQLSLEVLEKDFLRAAMTDAISREEKN